MGLLDGSELEAIADFAVGLLGRGPRLCGTMDDAHPRRDDVACGG
jgi:hypothetical protein